MENLTNIIIKVANHLDYSLFDLYKSLELKDFIIPTSQKYEWTMVVLFCQISTNSEIYVEEHTDIICMKL